MMYIMARTPVSSLRADDAIWKCSDDSDKASGPLQLDPCIATSITYSCQDWF